MNAESAMRITCSACNAVLKAKPELAGKRAKCPKCGAAIEVPAPTPQKPKKKPPLATQRQKEYAQTLGIAFPADITRPEISKLIDEAVTKQDQDRYDRLDELSKREGEAREKMRQEVLAEIDDEDCCLSKAEPSQILEALSERGIAGILITMPWNEIEDSEDLNGVSIRLSSCDDMEQEDMETAIIQCANELMKRKDII